MTARKLTAEGQRLVSAISKFAKIPNSLYSWVRGGGGEVQDQLPNFDAESKSAKIPNSLHGGCGSAKIPNFRCGGERGLFTTNFQLLMRSPNLLKSQIPCMVGCGGAVGVPAKLQSKLSKPESKPKFPVSEEVWGGGGGL